MFTGTQAVTDREGKKINLPGLGTVRATTGHGRVTGEGR